jgi:hypothetical protein
MTIVDVPWGAPLSLLYSTLNIVINHGGFKFQSRRLADRYPLPELCGALLQSFILIQALHFQFKHMDSAQQGSTCGFLLFNMLGLCSSVASTLGSLAAPLTALAIGLEKHNGEGSCPVMVAKLALALPGGAAAFTLLMMVVGAVPLLVTAIPSLLCFLHITIVQAIISCLPLVIIRFTMDGSGRFRFFGMAKRRDNGMEGGVMIGGGALIALALCQVVQSLGIMGWVWYLQGGPTYDIRGNPRCLATSARSACPLSTGTSLLASTSSCLCGGAWFRSIWASSSCLARRLQCSCSLLASRCFATPSPPIILAELPTMR